MSTATGKHYSVEFTLTLKAPFVTKGTGAMRFGLDTFSQSENGRLILNGTQHKGVIRHQLQSFADLLDDKQLNGLIVHAFGPASQTDDDKHFSGAALTFPWKMKEQENDNETLRDTDTHEKLYRIKMNPKTVLSKKAYSGH